MECFSIARPMLTTLSAMTPSPLGRHSIPASIGATLNPFQLSPLHYSMVEYGGRRHQPSRHLGEQFVDPLDGTG